MFVPMTDNQRFAFAKKSLVFQRLPTWRKGKQMPVMMLFAEQIAKDLLDEEKQKIYQVFLVKVGFNQR